ncbi:MAG: NRDE family protein [Salinivenus sp.]
MCLLTFAYDTHPDYALVFAGNRDEFYERPAAPATHWEDAPHVLAGRDLEAGGTWMGVTRNGHWAVVTNIRSPEAYRPEARSRGALVAEYLKQEPPPEAYLRKIAADADQYNGFNVLLGTPTSLYYLSSRDGIVQALAPGIYGLSNAQLNTPWPKVETAKSALRDMLGASVEPDALLELLAQREPFPPKQLPETGVGPETERLLSPLFIESDAYGTRASTVLLIERTGRVTFVERTFDEGKPDGTRRFSFWVDPT